MHLRQLKHALPIALILSGVYLLVGCIYIPTFGLPKDGKDFRGLVGEARSHRQIRPGNATRSLVIQLLGEPKLASRDGLTIAYDLSTMDGYVVWPLCFDQSSAVKTSYRLRLKFNAGGQLQSYQVRNQSSGNILSSNGVTGPVQMDEQDLENR